ncbi:MAG TPA: DUF3365 domain-containing protein [Povalibacter sp.]|nr:DUF3365 domain-containing protein [Povalibacter sp.]
MKLLLKFNLVFLLIFALGLGAAAAVSWRLLQANARVEVAENARLMMQTALATRGYTSAQVQPLLRTQLKYTFLPQSVPAYSATEVFNDLHTRFPDYSYKEAALNPTNPRDRAVEWESDIINQFRNGYSAQEIVGQRSTPTGESFYVARPLRITNPDCLVCHDTPGVAPPTMLERYGSANGFGWKLNDVIGAQIISVPASVPFARALQAFKVFMISITGVFLAIGIALNLMLFAMVIRPVARLSAVADRVSLGETDAPEFHRRSRDEIGVLVQSFGRMRKSLDHAMKMLEA